MPHDLINAKAVSVELRTVLVHAEKLRARNPVVQIERVRGEPCAELLAPAPCDVDAARAVFVDALPVIDAEVPKISTGYEEDFARAAGLAWRAPNAGEIVALATGAFVWLPQEGPASLVEPRAWPCAPRRVVDRIVRSSGRVSAGDVVFECDGAKDGKLALGRNARVRFDPSAKKATLSASFARAMRAATVSIVEAKRKDTRMGRQERGTASGLDDSGIVALGANVRAGDVLVALTTPEEGKPDPSLKARKANEGRVVRVDVFARRGSERSPRHERILAERRRSIDEIARIAKKTNDARWSDLHDEHESSFRGDELPPGVIEMVRVTIEREIDLVEGSRITDRHGAIFAVGAIEASLDVDVVLPETERAMREAREAGALYVMRAD